ncbi:RNA-directed DNA polymerase, eukaryota, Reverse transcriptase zinc-binding domain protein [Artemisia annua]|uniref:RNA-directed DNA polymerase, eukaryota, Reverse transcriptase zinc-binding domain protein n=1 Tax=Artemisia annua TaxID=35608 RepID=A0A2U1L146_ARTAN|nr:RNA-directed DNA polymerase, eukaryota, Reverse transcriptase zinc-binding domain protein [Artemisia annua]
MDLTLLLKIVGASRTKFEEEIGIGVHLLSGRASSELQSLSSIIDGVVLCPQVKDEWSWSFSNDGLFIVKCLSSIIDSAYLTYCSPGKTNDWISLVPRKINIFIWCLALDRLPLLTNLDWGGINVSSVLCPLCGDRSKTRDNIFLSCLKSLVIWHKCLSYWGIYVPSNLSVMDLVSGSLRNNFRKNYLQLCLLHCSMAYMGLRYKVVHSKI